MEYEIDINEDEPLSVLKEWRAKALALCAEHGRYRRIYVVVNYAMTCATVLLSSAAGAVSIMETEMDTKTMSLAAGIMSISAAGFATLQKFFELGEKIERNGRLEAEYDKLAREIRVEGMLTDTAARTYANSGILIKEIQERFDRLA
jgi:hypothetical protein